MLLVVKKLKEEIEQSDNYLQDLHLQLELNPDNYDVQQAMEWEDGYNDGLRYALRLMTEIQE
jgi:hypothetical protein